MRSITSSVASRRAKPFAQNVKVDVLTLCVKLIRYLCITKANQTPMEIEFEDKKLKKKLSKPSQAKRYFGGMASTIFLRIKQLEAANDEAELRLIPGGFHPLTGDREGQWACSLGANWRLIFRLRIEASYVAVIIEVVDYH